MHKSKYPEIILESAAMSNAFMNESLWEEKEWGPVCRNELKKWSHFRIAESAVRSYARFRFISPIKNF